MGAAPQYPYMTHLKELERRKPELLELPPWLWRVETPLVLDEWRKNLVVHPDPEYLLRGIQQGFRIGFRYGSRSRKSAKANMKLAMDNPSVVDEYLVKEVNRFGVIPKNHQPGK